MKNLVVVSLATFALASSSALAADMPLKAPPPPAATWTGCYVNGGLGYGMWNQDHYSWAPGSTFRTVTYTNGGRGWLGSLGAGCDYQVSSSFVIGVFGDYDPMSIKGTNEDPLPSPSDFSGSEKETGAWAIGGRLGYLVTPSLLTYVNGGYTRARFDQVNFNNVFTGTPVSLAMLAHTYDGWFLGGGTEYALGSIVPIPGLFWRTEYRFASYEAADVPVINTFTGDIDHYEHSTPYVQTITSGLVWRFNWLGR